jgi:cystathionine beta-lyase/cystathionine gamma-synthase
MCYESLLNGEAVERSLPSLLRGERLYAVRSGVAAAAVTLLALLSEGFGIELTIGLSVAALALGFVLHQAVLLCGACTLRLLNRNPESQGVEHDPARP